MNWKLVFTYDEVPILEPIFQQGDAYPDAWLCYVTIGTVKYTVKNKTFNYDTGIITMKLRKVK
jgi:hypothetical protein